MLLTEYSILEYLTRLEVPGIVQEHGLFQVSQYELGDANQAVVITQLLYGLLNPIHFGKRRVVCMICLVPPKKCDCSSFSHLD